MSQLLFPTLPGFTYPATRTVMAPPVRVKTTASGREFRARDSVVPRYRYSLQYELLRSSQALQEWQTLMGFFNSVGGPFDDWLFQDPDDGTVSNQVFATGNGSQTVFQLARTLGGVLEPVYGPLGTPTITVNGGASTPTVSALGAVTFASAPANGALLRWSGTFAWRCRFDGDNLEFTKNFAAFWAARRVQFLTTKPL
jgi:uncharacterized protein (TIGR02217 family)